MAASPKPRFFATPDAFGRWLEANHANAVELTVGYWKVGTGKPSMTWAQSVEQALRFGWIDGVRHSLSDEAYCIRFTPRRPGGNWSRINVATARRLIRQGRMAPAGLRTFKDRRRQGQLSSFEGPGGGLDAQATRVLRADPAAWRDWQARAPSYRKAAGWWIMTARREATREKRLASLLDASRKGRPVKHLARARANRP